MADKLSDAEVRQINELADRLGSKELAAAPDICGIWNQIKPYWPLILKAIGFIPVVGSKIVAILTLLATALNALCP